MKFEDAARQLDPEIYERFKRALELGKWPDGRPLTHEQKELCLQTIIVYEDEHNVPEHERTGYIDKSKKNKGQDKGGDAEPVRVLH